MADKFECLYCGLPVRRVPEAKKVWTKAVGEPIEEWVHSVNSLNGMPKCDKHFLMADEVVIGGSEVPVQN